MRYKYNNFTIGVLGLGYTGANLCVEFSKKINTIGYDISQRRVKELKNNKDRNLEVKEKNLKTFNKKKKSFFTSNESYLTDCNVFIITVPTPISKSNNPDLKFMKKAFICIAKFLKKNDIIIIESTVYPGLTEKLCNNFLKKLTKLKFNKDFFCGYSPERVNPGDKKNTLKNVIKIISGSNKKTTKIIKFIYQSVVGNNIYEAKSIKIAESAKIIENCQRDLNIAFMNELSILFNKMNINTHEVIKAASTKWNFNKYFPGLVGGHCIGIDPYYLLYQSKKYGYIPSFLQKARQFNNDMVKYSFNRITKFIQSKDLIINNIKILFLGATFKENCPDTRNSKSIELINMFSRNKSLITVCDPYIFNEEIFNKKVKLINRLNVKDFSKFNLIVMLVPHKIFNKFKKIKLKKSYIFELRNFFINKNESL